PIHSHGSDDWYMRTSLGPKRAACGACCLIKLYDGGVTYIDISSELRSHGLYLCQAVFNMNGWCDAIYGGKYWP
ncbi:hypothetical protein, partial [Synechococcus sp. Ace-Pa]